jgi:DNA-binding MarR family transcriptional regulator
LSVNQASLAAPGTYLVTTGPPPANILRMRTKSLEAVATPTARQNRRFVFLLNVAQRRLQRWMAARAQDSGVTAAQSGLLFVLGQRDGVLMSEAGAALDLGPPGISGLVERMIAAKLIQRRPDPDDGRAWRLWLTPAGRAALAETKAGLVEINARLAEGFSEAELDVVARWLISFQTKFPKGEEQ